MTDARVRDFLEQFAASRVAVQMGRSAQVWADRASLARVIIKRYPEFFDQVFLEAPGIRRELEEEVSIARAHGTFVADVTEADIHGQLCGRILTIAERLRLAWSDQDPRNKLWQGFVIRLLYHKIRGGGQFEAPEPTPFDRAIEYFQANQDKTRICRRIDCPNVRYFFRGEKDQRYCSTECSLAATKEVRNRSYHKNKGQKKAVKSKTRRAKHAKR